jgi:hypothetical protein
MIRIDGHHTGKIPTNTPHAFHTQSAYDPRIAIFREVINSDGHVHCSREKRLQTQSILRWLTDPQVRTQFLSQDNH